MGAIFTDHTVQRLLPTISLSIQDGDSEVRGPRTISKDVVRPLCLTLGVLIILIRILIGNPGVSRQSFRREIRHRKPLSAK